MNKNRFTKIVMCATSLVLFISLIPGAALASVIGTIEKIPTANSFSRADAISPDGKHLYVLVGGGNLGVSAALRSYQVDPASGKLTRFDEILYDANGVNGVNGLSSGADIAMSPDGKHVYTIGLGGSSGITRTINIFSRNVSNGLLSFVDSVASAADTGNFDHINGEINFSPDGFFLYLTASNPTELTVFQRSSVSGALSFVESFTGKANLPALDQPAQWLSNTYSSVVSPDGSQLYVVGHNGPTNGGDLIVFNRNKTDGTLTPLELQVSQITDSQGAITRDGIPSMNQLNSVTISADGNNVYAVAWADHTILSFTRNSDGTLTFMDAQAYLDQTQTNPDIMWGPESVKVSPNGRFVYVASGIGDSIVVYLRDLTTGELSPLGYVQGTNQNMFIANLVDMEISSSGRYLYAISNGASPDAITGFDLSADLVVSLMTDPANVSPASNYRYVVHVANAGASDASNVVVTTTLPATVTFISASTSVPGGSCTVNATEVTCSIPRIIVNSAEEAYIDVTAPEGNASVTVSSTASADQVEANALDNQASLTTTIGSGQPSQSGSNSTSDSSSGGSVDAWLAIMLAVLVALRLRRRHGALAM